MQFDRKAYMKAYIKTYKKPTQVVVCGKCKKEFTARRDCNKPPVMYGKDNPVWIRELHRKEKHAI